MWLLFFVIALVAAIVLFIHINLELKRASKSVDTDRNRHTKALWT